MKCMVPIFFSSCSQPEGTGCQKKPRSFRDNSLRFPRAQCALISHILAHLSSDHSPQRESFSLQPPAEAKHGRHRPARKVPGQASHHLTDPKATFRDRPLQRMLGLLHPLFHLEDVRPDFLEVRISPAPADTPFITKFVAHHEHLYHGPYRGE